MDNNLTGWINESLMLARRNAYVDTGGRLIKSGDQIREDYLTRNKPIILGRMDLAAWRLAHLLNQVASGTTPSVFYLTDSVSASR